MKDLKLEETTQEYISSDKCGGENISSMFGFIETNVFPDIDCSTHTMKWRRNNLLLVIVSIPCSTMIWAWMLNICHL